MSGPGAGVETRMEGSPEAVEAVAAWLREGLQAALEQAGDQLAAARTEAISGFHGEAGSAYERLDVRLLRLVDEHAERVARAADLFAAYAARLAQVQQAMAGYREEARGAGLTVTGTLVEEPAPTALALDHHRITWARLARDVPAERERFVAWVTQHVSVGRRDFDAAEVDVWVHLLRQHLDGLGHNLGRAYAEDTLEGLADHLADEAHHLETAPRSGDPARRALGLAPETPGRIDDLRGLSRLADVGGKLVTPVGVTADSYTALESEQPAGGLAGVGAGAVLGGLAVGGAAAVGMPAIAAVGTGAVVGYGASQSAQFLWTRLPDGTRAPVDDWVGDRWDDSKDAADDAWEGVKGWFRSG